MSAISAASFGLHGVVSDAQQIAQQMDDCRTKFLAAIKSKKYGDADTILHSYRDVHMQILQMGSFDCMLETLLEETQNPDRFYQAAHFANILDVQLISTTFSHLCCAAALLQISTMRRDCTAAIEYIQNFDDSRIPHGKPSHYAELQEKTRFYEEDGVSAEMTRLFSALKEVLDLQGCLATPAITSFDQLEADIERVRDNCEKFKTRITNHTTEGRPERAAILTAFRNHMLTVHTKAWNAAREKFTAEVPDEKETGSAIVLSATDKV